MYFTVSVDFYSEDTLSCVLGLDALRFSSWQCFFCYCFFFVFFYVICACLCRGQIKLADFGLARLYNSEER